MSEPGNESAPSGQSEPCADERAVKREQPYVEISTRSLERADRTGSTITHERAKSTVCTDGRERAAWHRSVPYKGSEPSDVRAPLVQSEP